jgi:chaperone modulatory protein CbpM
MRQEHIALLLDEAHLTVDDLAAGCTATREWVIERVQAGVLLTESAAEPVSEPARWAFTGADLRRARRLYHLERDFDANPELAGLVADMLDELERLRMRLRRLGMPPD